MPVYVLENEMPYTEYVNWFAYMKERPTGWREDQRAAMIMQALGVKQKPADLFPSIRQIHENKEASQRPDQAIPTGKFFEKMLNATGGDGSTPDWLKGL